MKFTSFIFLLFVGAALSSGCHKEQVTKVNVDNMKGVREWTGTEHSSVFTSSSKDTSYIVSFKILVAVIDDTTITTHLYDTASGSAYTNVTLHYYASDANAHTITYVTGSRAGLVDAYWADTLIYNYADNTMTQRQISSGMIGSSDLQIHTQ